jgi:hypothetical protein
MPRVQNQNRKMKKNCIKCGVGLKGYDSAIYRKLVNMLATEFMCIPCLAVHFGCDESAIHAQIEYFKQRGACGLFKL